MGLPTNEELVKRGKAALQNRMKRETTWAGYELIRHCENRPERRNWPWNGSSNIMVPRIDMAVTDWKAILTADIVRGRQLANFRALRQELVPLQAKAGSYHDQLVRNHTNYVQQIKFCSDDFEAQGMTYMKVTWDFDRQVPKYTKVGLLYIIRPSNSQMLEDDEWCYHVIQLSKSTVKRRWGHIQGVEELLARFSEDEAQPDHDQAQAEENLYKRVGIDRSAYGEDKKMVFWQAHYRGEGKKGEERLRTISPDEQDLDLEDDQEYPYNYCRDNGKYMIIEGIREYKNPKAYSSRGLTELGVDTQESESSARRTVQNLLTTIQAPMFMPSEGAPQGATQNFTFNPGGWSPHRVDHLEMPGVKQEWFNEIREMQVLNEQIMKKPDLSLTKSAGTEGGKDPRTATELNIAQNDQNIASDLTLSNWGDFRTQVARNGWGLCVQYKPKSMQMFFEGENSELEEQALSNDYMISVATDAELLNRDLQKAVALKCLELFRGIPSINQPQLEKLVLETINPEWAAQLWVEPAEASEDAMKKAVLDAQTMMITGKPVQIDPNGDSMAAAMVSFKLLSNPKELADMTPESAALILAWGQQNVAILAKKNPQAAEQMGQQFDQLAQVLPQAMEAIQNGSQPPQNGQGQPQEQKVSMSLPFEKLPISGKIQVAAKGGVQLTPEDLAHQEAMERDKENRANQAKAEQMQQKQMAGAGV